MNLIRSGAVGTISNFINDFASFIGIIVLAIILPQAELGRFFLFQTVLGLLGIVASAGLNGAVEKRISEGEPEEIVFGSAIAVKGVILAGLSGIVLLASGPINAYIGSELAHLLVLGLIFQETSALTYRTLRGEQRVSLAYVLQSVRVLFWICLGIALAQLGFGVDGLAAAFIGGYVLLTVLGLYLQDTGLGHISTTQLHSLYDYAKHNVVTSVGGSIYGWTDTAVLGFFVGAHLVAAYEIAWRISKVGLVISSSVATTTFPKISEWSEAGETDRIGATVSASLVPALIVVIPAFFGVLVLGPELLTTIYGPEYAVAAGAFVVLSLERIVKAATQVISRCLHAINRPDLSARATVLAIVANIVLNVLLIPPFGILGAAVATSTSFFTKFAFESYFAMELLSFEVPIKEILLMISAAIGMAACIWFAKVTAGIEAGVETFLLVFAGAVVYSVLLSLSSSMRKLFGITLRELSTGF